MSVVVRCGCNPRPWHRFPRRYRFYLVPPMLCLHARGQFLAIHWRARRELLGTMVCIGFDDQDMGVPFAVDFPFPTDEMSRFIDDFAILSHRNPHLTVNDLRQLKPPQLTSPAPMDSKHTCLSSTVPGDAIASSISLTISCMFSGLISGGNIICAGPSTCNTNSR